MYSRPIWRGAAPHCPPLSPEACAARGLLLLNCSVYETLRFIPPLTVAPAEVDEACDVFDAALAEVVA